MLNVKGYDNNGSQTKNVIHTKMSFSYVTRMSVMMPLDRAPTDTENNINYSHMWLLRTK